MVKRRWNLTKPPAGMVGKMSDELKVADLVTTDPLLLGLDSTILPQSGVGVVINVNSRSLVDVLWDGEIYRIHSSWVTKVQEE